MRLFNKIALIVIAIYILSIAATGCGGGGGGTTTSTTTGGSTTDDITGSTAVANYTLSLSVSPSATAGTVTASPGSSRYAAGTIVTLAATPAAGYRFKNWDGADAADVTDGRILMNANKSVTAVFEVGTSENPVAAKYTLALSVSPSSNAGTLTASPSAQVYDGGTQVTLTTTPAAGYAFKSWSGTNASDIFSGKITMNANKSVTAVFEALTYSLSLSVSPSVTSGTVTASPAGPYAYGSVVTLSYTPYLGNRFARWDGTSSVDVASDKITMNADKALTATFESAAAATSKTITVDASNDLGTFKMTMGSHNGPVSLVRGVDETSKYRELGFKNIRTIDYYGPFTWYNCFPDFTKDPESEDSYDFSTTDVRVSKLVNEGFEILFNFAPSWTDPVYKNTADPPGTVRNSSGAVIHAATVLDFQKFANVARHIVMHYNDGWKNGYRYNIKRWELWNEPETNDKFWTGTPMQFFQMYAEVAKALKTYNSGLILYGPGNAETIPPTNPHTSDPNTYTATFMQYCRDNGAPIDVYTWHSYGGTAMVPSHIKTVADDIRTKLNTYGFNSTLSSCDEWNSGINNANFADSGKGAAYYGCALAFMTEKEITEFYQYRGDDHPLGILRDTDGQFKTAAYTLKAWKQMTESCKRLGSSTSETGEFAVVSSKSSADGTYYALASNFTSENKTLKLTLANISSPPAKGWMLTRKIITNTQKLDSAETGTIAADTRVAYTFSLPSYTVAFIQLVPNP